MKVSLLVVLLIFFTLLFVGYYTYSSIQLNANNTELEYLTKFSPFTSLHAKSNLVSNELLIKNELVDKPCLTGLNYTYCGPQISHIQTTSIMYSRIVDLGSSYDPTSHAKWSTFANLASNLPIFNAEKKYSSTKVRDFILTVYKSKDPGYNLTTKLSPIGLALSINRIYQSTGFVPTIDQVTAIASLQRVAMERLERNISGGENELFMQIHDLAISNASKAFLFGLYSVLPHDIVFLGLNGRQLSTIYEEDFWATAGINEKESYSLSFVDPLNIPTYQSHICLDKKVYSCNIVSVNTINCVYVSDSANHVCADTTYPQFSTGEEE